MKTKTIIALLGAGGIFIYSFLREIKYQQDEAKGFENLNLKLQGIVTSVNEVSGYNGYGIITVHILQTNIVEYDPRGKLEFYFCVIKNNVAEIYSHAYNYMVGDTLNIDTKRELESWGSEWNEANAGSIGINPSSGYYDWIQKRTGFR